MEVSLQNNLPRELIARHHQQIEKIFAVNESIDKDIVRTDSLNIKEQIVADRLFKSWFYFVEKVDKKHN